MRLVLDSGHRRGDNQPAMPWYVYILRCADGKHYTGCTDDLRQRLAEHRAGLSRWTASRLPVELVYFEVCETLSQARRRERSFKNGRTRRKTIERLISDFPPERLAPYA